MTCSTNMFPTVSKPHCGVLNKHLTAGNILCTQNITTHSLISKIVELFSASALYCRWSQTVSEYKRRPEMSRERGHKAVSARAPQLPLQMCSVDFFLGCDWVKLLFAFTSE